MKLVHFTLCFAICAAALIGFAVADTPAHCLWDQVSGKWRFYLSPNTHDRTVNCSLAFEPSNVLEVMLDYPNVVTDSNGNKGTWTMIYDQGFEVRINGQKYFAFSYYTQDAGNVTSYCERTFPGWYHDNDGSNWGCYYGIKLDHAASDINEDIAPLLLTDGQHHVYRPDYEFIRRINKAQNLWVAGDYPEYHGVPVQALQRRAGHSRRSPLVDAVPAASSRPAAAAASAQHARPLHSKQQPVNLPESFDWRNVSGVNYVSPVRNQGHCGSCYAFASAALLESRVRIMTLNKDQPVLAPQDVVSCSQYAQGCSGGFPYLTAGKYANDFGIVTEDCFPYQAADAPCSQRCQGDAPRYYASDYFYVGGYYGAASAEAMQLEIFNNGPIAVGFEVYPDFHNYKSGVYTHTSVGLSSFNPFQVVNHAVLVVGWGVTDDTNTPYWIVKNSWADTWGEQGYFRILRGTNECGIESIAVAALPLLP